MFASLSPEVRAPGMLRELGVSNAFISALCRIEQSKLSLALRQLKPLSNEEGLRLISTLTRLIEVRDAVQPLQPDLTNPTNTRALLNAFDGLDAAQVAERISQLFQQ